MDTHVFYNTRIIQKGNLFMIRAFIMCYSGDCCSFLINLIILINTKLKIKIKKSLWYKYVNIITIVSIIIEI